MQAPNDCPAPGDVVSADRTAPSVPPSTLDFLLPLRNNFRDIIVPRLPQEAKDAILKQLIADHEPPYAQQWRSLPETYTHAMLNAIVAFEMQVQNIQTKVKLNQHRPEAHAAMHAAYESGSESEKALALWMRRLGMTS